MSSPPIAVHRDAKIEDAARLMAEHDIHRLVVVDEGVRLVGFVSVLDVMRGLLGIPTSHPASFPHFDRATGVKWTDAAVLDVLHADRAPEQPGVFVLSVGGEDAEETDIWIEATLDLRGRLRTIAEGGSGDAQLTELSLRYRPWLRFRAAPISDPERRQQVLLRLNERAPVWVHRGGVAESSRPGI